MPRADGRMTNELRPVRITPHAAPYAEGSALIEMGNTHVLCAASVEQGVPPWLRDQGQGWLTAEYALLPRSTRTRVRRERPSPSGRTQEIQRLIGRSLRAAVDITMLGENTITVDCDVLRADGGTRTAAITGGYVALVLAIHYMQHNNIISTNPLRCAVAAISAGILGDVVLLDLDYSEDSMADVDCNVVQTNRGHFVEVQGTAEGNPLSRAHLNALLDIAETGVQELLDIQNHVVESAQPNGNVV